MATEHSLIPDGKRHEPKGIAAAVIGQIYRSDGSASGAWKDDVISLSGVIDDVSTASFILLPLPANCIVVSVKAVLANAITVANSAVTITRGGDGLTVASLTIPFTGSAEGTTINNTSPGNNTLVANTHNYLKVATDGASTTTAKLYVVVKVKVTE